MVNQLLPSNHTNRVVHLCTTLLLVMIFLETAFAMAVAMSGYVWLCRQVKKKNLYQCELS